MKNINVLLLNHIVLLEEERFIFNAEENGNSFLLL